MFFFIFNRLINIPSWIENLCEKNEIWGGGERLSFKEQHFYHKHNTGILAYYGAVFWMINSLWYCTFKDNLFQVNFLFPVSGTFNLQKTRFLFISSNYWKMVFWEPFRLVSWINIDLSLIIHTAIFLSTVLYENAIATKNLYSCVELLPSNYLRIQLDIK